MSEVSKINYAFGVDLNSSVIGTALIPTTTGKVSGSMETSLPNMIQLLSKPNYFGKITWTSTFTGTNFSFPTTLFNATLDTEAFFGQVFRMFAYLKTGLRFRFKVNGSPFHKGLLGVSWVPGDTPTQYNVDANYFVANGICYPSVRLSAAGTSEYVLEVPSLFPYQFHYMADVIDTVSELFQMGNLVIYPMSALEAATGASPDIYVSMWVEFVDLQLAGPTIINNTVGILKHPLIPIHQGMLDAVMDPISGAAKATVSSVVDGGSQLIKGGIRSVVSNIPIVGSLLAGFLDKPPLKTEPLKICRTSASSWTHGVGVSNASSLTVVPGLLRPPKNEEVGKIGTIFDYIRIPGLVRQFDINISSVPNVNIFTIAVDPTIPYSNSTDVFTNVTTPTPGSSFMTYEVDTPLSYMSRMYSLWRGTIRYSLEVVMPATTTCSLAIAWVPDQSLGSQTYDQVASQCSTWLMDCNGPTTSHFDVMFMSSTVYKYCMASDINGANKGNPAYYNNLYMNGTIGVYLVNAVMSNIAAPTTVTIRLYQSAGDDFEYCIPGGSLRNTFCYGVRDVGSPSPIEKIEAVHQGLTDDVPVSSQQLVTSDEVDVKALPILSQPVVMESFLGESHMEPSILKRYQLLYMEDLALSAFTDQLISIPVCPSLTSYIRCGTPQQESDACYINRFSTPLCHFAMAHRFWRGSLNYRIVVSTNQRGLIMKGSYVFMDSHHAATGESDAYTGPGKATQCVSTAYTATPTGGMTNVTRPQSMWTADASDPGFELLTQMDGGVVDISVPYFSDQPVKSCLVSTGSWGSTSFADTGQSLINNCWDGNSVNHMTGNVVFSCYSPSAANARIEIYVAAGDDFVCSYPVAPPTVNTFQNPRGFAFPLS